MSELLVKAKIAKFREYLDYFERHYDNVQKAWALINEKCADKGFRFMYDDFVWATINAEVRMHDDSKLSKEEFTQYRNYWFPAEGEDKDKESFRAAWEHHKAHNEHHWQTWTEKYSTSPYADAYLVMNVIDWVAMGFEFNSTAKGYYENTKSEIHIPEWAIKLMYKIFDCIYE